MDIHSLLKKVSDRGRGSGWTHLDAISGKEEPPDLPHRGMVVLWCCLHVG